jgi:transposase InsO family protein
VNSKQITIVKNDNNRFKEGNSMIDLFISFLLSSVCFILFIRLCRITHRAVYYGHCKSKNKKQENVSVSKYSPVATPKPDWVKDEIIKLKALMPDSGCRKIAAAFNRRYAKSKQVTVGKTYVSYIIREYNYEITVLRKEIKHKQPKPIPKNKIWGIDLTGKTDEAGATHFILGVIEHHSRGCLCLTAISNKSSITLLRCLLDCFEKHGTPRLLRTDNEAVFTSKLFRLGLWLLNIKHQTTDIHCPWQNGRIERFFGTLKEKLNQWEVESIEQLNLALGQFRFWYNHVRPHQHLNDCTPAEVWEGRDVYERKSRKVYWFEAWDGLLRGYYLPP